MTQEKSKNWAKWTLSTCGVGIVVYCLIVLGFVATAPDIGLRCMLSGENQSPESFGTEIKMVTKGMQAKGVPPQAGDILVAVGRQPVATFMHFTRRLMDLRNPSVPRGGILYEGADPLSEGDLLPPIVEIAGERWVEVETRRPGRDALQKSWLLVQSLPLPEVVLSFVWFILEFGIFMVGALAFWTRPFDRQARLFYAMCIVTLGGFVGGYHWWPIAGSLWLTIPFTICAMLLPVVTLHFFLIYPQPKPPLAVHAFPTLFALYAVPVLATAGMTAVMGYSFWIFNETAADPHLQHVLRALDWSIYAYLGIAATYFALTLVALLNSFFTTRNPIIHSQVKWILWAGAVATLPVGYTLYLSEFHQVEFAFGAASLPMFTASLLFMLAYAVGIVRYKLMLVDEILNRGMLYYTFTLLATVGYSVAIASSSIVGMYQHMKLSQQAFSMMATVMVAVILLGWFRDRLQQIIDRRFFREKFQLDRALQRMNQAATHVVEPSVLADRMLTSCRDVLGVDRAALYLRDGSEGVFQLIASEGTDRAPLQFPTDREFLNSLSEDVSLQRHANDMHDVASRTQLMLRELNVDLIHALEADGDLAGVLLLGPKRNGSTYTAEDLTFLAALGQITSVALHGTKAHQALARLNEELRLKVDKVSEQQRIISMLQAEITSRQGTVIVTEQEPFQRDFIKGRSPAIRSVLETVRKVSGSQSSVLIRGESGTGKELLAQALHENSPRRAAPLVSVHCGALSAGVLESELFGHVKGSFTGAHRDRVGRFEMANGGTLFLDEIGDISLETQIKLLRVLQERCFEPVGGSRPIQVDVRLIAATHQNLEKLIAEGKFREDLYYRLNVISIVLPPLRERVDDIFELALHFLGQAAARVGKEVTHFDDEALQLLQRYGWPGNIRELENAVERAVVLAEKSSISPSELPPQIINYQPGHEYVIETKPIRMKIGGAIDHAAPVEQKVSGYETRTANAVLEREQLNGALKRTNGNKAEAARLLGMPRSTFFSKLKKHGIE